MVILHGLIPIGVCQLSCFFQGGDKLAIIVVVDDAWPAAPLEGVVFRVEISCLHALNLSGLIVAVKPMGAFPTHSHIHWPNSAQTYTRCLGIAPARPR